MKRTAYFTHIFPSIPTTFTQFQVRETRRLGLPAVTASINPPKEGEYHPEDQDLLDETFYLTPFKLGRYLKANLKAFFRDPGRYLKGLALVLTLTDDLPRRGIPRDNFPDEMIRSQRLRNLKHLAGAAVLSEFLLEKEVEHVHVHFAFGAASIAIFLNILTGISYSLSVHGAEVILPNPLIEEKVRRARFVISNCRFHIRNLRKRFPSLEKQRFYIVRGGVDLDSGRWSEYKRPEPDSCLRILHVARLDPLKSQDILLKACAGLRDRGIKFECRIVGDGPLRGSLEGMIDELQLKDHVMLLGEKYADETAALYDWSHVFVLSSNTEGTPMVIIESLAKARPVVATDVAGIPEMVKDNLTGWLVKPYMPEELAERLARLAGRTDIIEKMGQEGRRTAEELFDVNKNARRFMTVFSREIPQLAIKEMDEVEYE